MKRASAESGHLGRKQSPSTDLSPTYPPYGLPQNRRVGVRSLLRPPTCGRGIRKGWTSSPKESPLPSTDVQPGPPSPNLSVERSEPPLLSQVRNGRTSRVGLDSNPWAHLGRRLRHGLCPTVSKVFGEEGRREVGTESRNT